ncbi:MAG: hypothetical protein ONB44_15530 [candidate division KSB1 bacterium]|nr:hypothetical protein [candidate division KSB1 bacterium]MDZ7303542.1 hypothetical protein [candidate division KSB1 bacterium]MDZ7312785.1 hypothetical protein [candidate division KSB1 bacterium]
MLYLPDQAVREIGLDEVARYTVVRVADEIVVDLMHKACEVTYKSAESHIQYYELEGVRIPFLTPELLIQTKLSLRAKDVQDRIFLEQLLNLQKGKATETILNHKKERRGHLCWLFKTIRRLFRRSEKEQQQVLF